jgi:hypothetical protein
VVGPAAAAEHPHGGDQRTRLAVALGQVDGITGIERLGLVELGVALRRCVGPHPAEPGRPRRRPVEQVAEVRGVGAVDHVVDGVRTGGVVDGLDRLA